MKKGKGVKKKEIFKVGSFLKVNNQGYFVSDLKPNSIQPKWGLAVREAVKVLRKNIPGIYCIYVRGSVATGRAIDNVSDVDFLLVSNKPMRDIYKQKAYNNLEELNKNFTYITRFDVGYYTKDEILKVKERILVKLRSVCVFGKDLSLKIPPPKPGRDVCVTLLGLEREITQTITEIEEGYYTKENTKAMCTWIMKRLVRGGLELVSEIDNVYTRDLYICYERFSFYYPSYKQLSYKAMELAVYPEDKVSNIKKVLQKFGGFLIKEAQRKKII